MLPSGLKIHQPETNNHVVITSKINTWWNNLCCFVHSWHKDKWLLCTMLQTAASRIVTPEPTPTSVSVCVSVHNHISVTTHPIFTNFLCRLPIATAPFTAGVAGKLCTSSFTDYVIFPHNGPYGGMSIPLHWVTSLCRHAQPTPLMRRTGCIGPGRVYFARGYGGKACNASVPCRFQNWQVYWFWTLL